MSVRASGATGDSFHGLGSAHALEAWLDQQIAAGHLTVADARDLAPGYQPIVIAHNTSDHTPDRDLDHGRDRRQDDRGSDDAAEFGPC